MQLLEEYKSDMRKLKTLLERGVDYRTVAAILAQSQYILKDYPDERKYCFAYSKAVKDIALRQYAETLKPEWDEMYWQAMLWEAPELFESYLIYLERKREEPERFYLPKREQLNKHGLIQAMQDLEDDKLDLLSISMPPGTQKTTLEKFFCSWIIGKHPKDYSLFFSHSGDITEMFYKGVLDITTNNIEYTWAEIFPKVKLQATNAKAETINFDKYKPYANIQCTSVG